MHVVRRSSTPAPHHPGAKQNSASSFSKIIIPARSASVSPNPSSQVEQSSPGSHCGIPLPKRLSKPGNLAPATQQVPIGNCQVRDRLTCTMPYRCPPGTCKRSASGCGAREILPTSNPPTLPRILRPTARPTAPRPPTRPGTDDSIIFQPFRDPHPIPANCRKSENRFAKQADVVYPIFQHGHAFDPQSKAIQSRDPDITAVFNTRGCSSCNRGSPAIPFLHTRQPVPTDRAGDIHFRAWFSEWK